MMIIKLHSWDVKKNADGTVVFVVHRHDSSTLNVPLGLNLQPVGSPDVEFEVIAGDLTGYCGFCTGWIPQPV